ncbi:MAG: hypothetical protein R3350_10035 [Saprospiraceae bacterium]|nr:hypothetical protein [Saprospiraceae bacterium]
MKKFLDYTTPIAEVFSVILIGNILAALLLSQLLDPQKESVTPQ